MQKLTLLYKMKQQIVEYKVILKNLFVKFK